MARVCIVPGTYLTLHHQDPHPVLSRFSSILPSQPLSPPPPLLSLINVCSITESPPRLPTLEIKVSDVDTDLL